MSKLTDDIDALLAPALPEIEKLQATELARRKRYAQFLVSHSAPPKDSANVAPDKLSTIAESNDRTCGEMWSAAKFPASAPFRVRVDEYAGPSGVGYVIICQVEEAGRLWERRINAGPEKGREMAWTDITE